MQAKAEPCIETNPFVQILKALLRFLSTYIRLRCASIKSGLGLQLVLGPIRHFGLVKLQSSSVIALCPRRGGQWFHNDPPRIVSTADFDTPTAAEAAYCPADCVGSIRPRPREPIGPGASVDQLLNFPVLEVNHGNLATGVAGHESSHPIGPDQHLLWRLGHHERPRHL